MAISLGGGGGVSVPIGGQVKLLDTAATVTKGGEVFLRAGITAASSTYPDAPVKSYINNGTLTDYSPSNAISPWQGNSTVYPNEGGAMHDTGSSELFVVTSSGYVNKFSNSGVTFVSARNLRDGTVFPTTCNRYAISCVNYGWTARAQGSNMASSNLRAFISGDGGTNGLPAIAYLSNDLQTHYGTFTLNSISSAAFPSDRSHVKAAFVSSSYFVVVYDKITNGTDIHMARYPVPNFSASTSTLSFTNVSTITQGTRNWSESPELIPYVYSGNHQNYVGWRGYQNNTPLIYMYNGMGTNVTGYSASASYDTSNISFVSSSTWRAPIANNNSGIHFIRNGVTTPVSASYTNTSSGSISFDTAFDSTLYSGYAYKNSTTVYVGHSGENKAYAVNPSTLAVSATIDFSSQAAPYRFAHHNNVLYNLNGTNIHTYSTTSNAFVSTIDISNKVSGTDAVGIAHDGTNLYVLDGSNSKIHKYNATGTTYVSFVTLSDTPHTSLTLESLAVDLTKGVFWVTHGTSASLYALDGTTKSATAGAGWKDVDVHDGHAVGTRADSLSFNKFATVDTVGDPNGFIGATTTDYYRVS